MRKYATSVSFFLVLTSCNYFDLEAFRSKERMTYWGGPSPHHFSLPPAPREEMTMGALVKQCIGLLEEFPGPSSKEDLRESCEKVKLLNQCYSVEGRPIFHYDKISSTKGAQRVLTFGLTHGDEVSSGSVARAWMERLNKIDPRNSWRVIPVHNPDGWKKKSRVNANGVDLNRNFPTRDWEKTALKHWKVDKKKDPRRYPGPRPGSEIETRCAMDHLDDFRPDIIISIHTPYGVLDFDGPKVSKVPKVKSLPWISLGTFPGSLGRYMWHDNEIPVLTIELKGVGLFEKFEDANSLQDITGGLALQIDRAKRKPSRTGRK